MISVWPFFECGSAVYDEMDKRGWFIDRTKVAGFHPEGMAVYDASNPEARACYWQLMNKALFQIGVDAWWLDTVEPETEGREENIQLGHKLAIGRGDPRFRVDRCGLRLDENLGGQFTGLQRCTHRSHDRGVDLHFHLYPRLESFDLNGHVVRDRVEQGDAVGSGVRSDDLYFLIGGDVRDGNSGCGHYGALMLRW